MSDEVRFLVDKELFFLIEESPSEKLPAITSPDGEEAVLAFTDIDLAEKFIERDEVKGKVQLFRVTSPQLIAVFVLDHPELENVIIDIWNGVVRWKLTRQELLDAIGFRFSP